MRPSDGPPRRASAAFAPAGVAVVAFAWLAWPGADPAVALFNMDVLYHVHRIARCLQDFPWVSSVDTYSHAGAAFHLHWPGPHSLLYALIARLAGVGGGDLLALTSTLSWVPPFLGALAAAVTVLLARACGLREPFAVLAGFACALSGDALVVFHHGAIDHHAFTALALPLALAAFLRRWLAAWVAALVLLFSTSPEATPYLTLVMLALAACEGLGAAELDADRMPRPALFFLAPAGAALVAWMLTRALDPLPPPLLEPSVFGLSIFQPAWLLLLGGGAFLGATLPRRGRTLSDRRTVLLGVALGAASLLLLGLLALGQLGEIVERLAQAQRQQVGEELPLYRFLQQATTTHWGAWTALLILVGVGAAARSLVMLQRRAPPRLLLAALLPLGAVILAFMELHHARSLAPLPCVALACACADAFDGLRLARPLATRVGAVAVATLIAVLVVPPFAWHAVELRRTLRIAATWPQAIGALCDWTRDNLPDAGPRDAPPSRAVFGPWEWGHHLNVLGETPVIVDGFNNESDDNLATWQVWIAETGDEFADAARAHGATHVVITGAPGSILGLLRRTSYEVARREPSLPGGVLYLPALRRHAAFRLDERGGLIDDSGRLMPLWSSTVTRPLAVLDGDTVTLRDVPSARLFAIVPGCEITGTAPPGTALVTATIRYRIGETGAPATVTRRVAVDGDGVFSFRTALPSPWRSGPLVVLEPYSINAGRGDVMVTVPEAAVRQGLTVRVPDAAGQP